MPVDRVGVHATHCCPDHGCKYCDDDCPVVSGEVDGIFCEACEYDLELLKELSERSRLGDKL